MSAEDVKRVLESYQREHFPKGRCASAMFETGEVGGPETLVVILADPPSSSSESAPESPSEPARSGS